MTQVSEVAWEEPRVDRLLRKAEEAAGEGALDKAEEYRQLADLAFYVERKQAKDLRRMLTGQVGEAVTSS